MEVVFNELSLTHRTKEERLLDHFRILIEIFREIKNSYECDHILFPQDYATIQVSPGQSFIQWITNVSSKERDIILSLIRKPYREENLGDEDNKTLEYYFVSQSLGLEQEFCQGLATADIKGIPAISLASHDEWVNTEIEINRESNDTPNLIRVKNISNQNSIEDPKFIKFVESQMPVTLMESDLDPADKSIHLREDHGKDKLRNLANRMVRNPYVVGVINSIPFNPHSSLFINKIYPDGKIKIVLHWDDRGIGMIIQTTGRNYYETKEIGNKLRDKYDR